MADESTNGTRCGGCERAAQSRRAFLRDAALLAIAALGAIGVAPDAALARTVRPVSARRGGAARVDYDLPPEDGVQVDEDNDVILVRWAGQAWAFSLACPHKGTRLRWRADEDRFFCPRHKARFTRDGAHASGRRTRSLDRYHIRRAGDRLLVDLDALHREDQDPDGWRAAVVRLG